MWGMSATLLYGCTAGNEVPFLTVLRALADDMTDVFRHVTGVGNGLLVLLIVCKAWFWEQTN